MRISDIQTAFPDIVVPNIGNYYTEKIQLWQNVFEGDPSWKTVGTPTVSDKKKTRTMGMLNVAKVLCDCFTDLTFSEQVEITVDNEGYQEYINNQLNANGFWKNMPELLANAYALGGCAVKAYVVDKQPKIDYIHADKFAPLAWNGKEVYDGAFVSVAVKDGNYYTLIERQSKGKVEYKLYCSWGSGVLGSPVELSELYGDLPPETKYGDIDIPMFAYFKPSVSNNCEYDTPLGMSIYGNALDTLKALDVAFDSFSREFVLGKKRIIVPASCLQTVTDNDGNFVRYFDANDEAFVAFNAEDVDNFKVTDNTVELRVEEHVKAINALLNILCLQVGLSAGSLSFDAVQGVKTATEVISQDSKTHRTIKSNQNLLTEMIESMVHSLIALGVWLGDIPKQEYKLTVGWQDNVVVDDNTLIDNTIKQYSAGLIDLETALMKVHKFDEESAKKMAEKIRAGSAVGTADFFGN